MVVVVGSTGKHDREEQWEELRRAGVCCWFLEQEVAVVQSAAPVNVTDGLILQTAEETSEECVRFFSSSTVFDLLKLNPNIQLQIWTRP